MNEDFTSEALLHLLEQSDPDRRAGFERHLRGDAAATAAYKTCVDAYARFALEAAPAEAVSPESCEEMLQAILARVEQVAPGALPPAPGAAAVLPSKKWGTAVLWPIAASLLLLLNLWQWSRQRRADRQIHVLAAASAVGGRPSSGGPSAANDLAIAGPNVGGANVIAVQGGLSPRVAAELKRLEALQREYRMVSQDRDTLTKQYNAILSQLVAAASADPGTGKLVAMELVDANSYDRGVRKGLINLAETLLTTPGIVAVEPAPPPENAGTAPVGTSPSLSAISSSSVSSDGITVTQSAATGAVTITLPPGVSLPPGFTVPSLSLPTGSTLLAGSSPTLAIVTTGSVATTAVSLSAAASTPVTGTNLNLGPVDASNVGAGQNISSTSVVPPAPSESDAAAPAPYAWSVYDDSAHQGYLNLYDLPSVPSGSQLELWVQPAGSADFQPVGPVPSQYYGQSGSLYYKLPNGVATPSQILITVEPAGVPATTPSGTTVLRGP